MGGVGQRGRNPGTGVALGRIQLELDEEDGPGEVSTSDIRASEVGTDDVGQSHIGTTEVSPDEACASQAGPSQVGAREVGPDEVGSPVVLLEPDSGSHELARGQQQVVDGATPKALLSQAGVNAAAIVRLQVRTSLPGGLVDRKVRRG